MYIFIVPIIIHDHSGSEKGSWLIEKQRVLYLHYGGKKDMKKALRIIKLREWHLLQRNPLSNLMLSIDTEF